MGKNEKDFKDLIQKIVLLVLAFLVVASLVAMIFFKKYLFGGTVTRKMIKEDTFLVFINGADCSNCQKIKEFLVEENVPFEELEETSSDAEDIFKEYEFNLEKSVAPAVLYIKDGKLYSNLVNINTTEELKLFIKNYKLSK